MCIDKVFVGDDIILFIAYYVFVFQVYSIFWHLVIGRNLLLHFFAWFPMIMIKKSFDMGTCSPFFLVLPTEYLFIYTELKG